MDLLIEFIGEILTEGSIELIKSKNVPLFIRIMLLLIFSSGYLAFVGLIFFAAIKNQALGFIILSLIGVLLLILYIVWIYKLIKD